MSDKISISTLGSAKVTLPESAVLTCKNNTYSNTLNSHIFLFYRKNSYTRITAKFFFEQYLLKIP